MITLITPTCDQPLGISLCEKYMARQTLKHDQWIVVDDGTVPARLTMQQTHVLRKRERDCTPAQSLGRNLLIGIALAKGDTIICVEHDDWYAPTHIEQLRAQLSFAPVAGDDLQRYYHVGKRCWRLFQNKGASLCQTGMRREMLPRFEQAIHECLKLNQFFIDYRFWMKTTLAERSLMHSNTVLGIKGLPGRAGIGIGHRPEGPKWTQDKSGAQLRKWIGDDAEQYLEQHI